MNTDTVYLVSSGEYSDYRIHAAFSERSKAEEYIAKLDNFRADIEEWPLDPVVPEPPADRWEYRVCIAEDGRVTHCDRRSRFTVFSDGSVGIHQLGDEPMKAEHWPIFSGVQYLGFNPEYAKRGSKVIGMSLDINCYAADDQHAAKIANEKRVQFLAAGIWPKTFEEWLANRKGYNVASIIGESA